MRAATASLQAELNAATAEPDDDALDAELLELQKSGPALEKKLASMKSGNDSMPAADVEALQRQFNVYLTEWKKRRKGAKEMIGMVAEGAAKSWKEKNFCVRPHTAHTRTRRAPPQHSARHRIFAASSLLPASACGCVVRRIRASRRTRR